MKGSLLKRKTRYIYQLNKYITQMQYDKHFHSKKYVNIYKHFIAYKIYSKKLLYAIRSLRSMEKGSISRTNKRTGTIPCTNIKIKYLSRPNFPFKETAYNNINNIYRREILNKL